MATLAIVWRNPTRVRRQLRWSRHSSPSFYIVQELISAARDVWQNVTALELIAGHPSHGVKAVAESTKKSWRMSLGW